MKYYDHETEDQPGQDSFLDVVANIVGILIILSTVVGVRAAHAPPIPKADPAEATESEIAAVMQEKSHQEVAQLTEALNTARKHITSLQSNVTHIVKQVLHAEHEVEQQDAERTELQSIITLLNTDLEKRRAALNETQRQELDSQRQIAESRAQLEKLAREQCVLDMASNPVETIVSLPTPLSKTSHGDEIHIRLAQGRVSIVPIDALVALFEQDVETNLWKLQNHDELIETVGPISGFRLRYRLARQAYLVPHATTIQEQTTVQLDQWEVLPVTDDLGVPAEQALLVGSDLQKALANKSTESTTVTIWVYPDSFAQFRMLKKALFDMGYSAAARPLPHGVRIGGSPRGTKSSVQ